MWSSFRGPSVPPRPLHSPSPLSLSPTNAVFMLTCAQHRCDVIGTRSMLTSEDLNRVAAALTYSVDEIQTWIEECVTPPPSPHHHPATCLHVIGGDR